MFWKVFAAYLCSCISATSCGDRNHPHHSLIYMRSIMRTSNAALLSLESVVLSHSKLQHWHCWATQLKSGRSSKLCPCPAVALWISPVLVSLSRTRKEPILLPEDNSSRSASFLLRVLKNHLGDRKGKTILEKEKLRIKKKGHSFQLVRFFTITLWNGGLFLSVNRVSFAGKWQ